VSTVTSLLLAAGTLAFGAVYPWAYLPLFAAASCIGLAGILRRRGVPAEARGVAAALALIALAACGQLVPLTRSALDFLSPHAAEILTRYSLTFANTTARHPLSIDPNATGRALMGLAALGLYLIGLSALFSRRDLRTFPRNVMVIAVLLGLIGIFSREHNNGLVFGFWQPNEGSYHNGFGPFINRNHFAGWMLMAFCLGFGFLLDQFQRASQNVPSGSSSRRAWLSSPDANMIVLTTAGLVVMATSLVWTMSRSGIVGFGVALGFFAWGIARRTHVGAVQRASALVILVLILIIGIGVRGANTLTTWFTDTHDLQGRLAAWADGWKVIRDFPMTGTGLDTFGTTMLYYQESNRGLHLGSAHNDYLQVVSEGGLLVAVPAAIAVFCLIVAIRRNLRVAERQNRGYWVRAGAAIGLIAIAVQEIAEFSLQIPANAALFCTLAAVALSTVETRRAAGAAHDSSRKAD
jgi:hypothetical protein